jgi:hypothetical protein
VSGPTLVTPDESTGPIDRLPSAAHEATQFTEAVDTSALRVKITL